MSVYNPQEYQSKDTGTFKLPKAEKKMSRSRWMKKQKRNGAEKCQMCTWTRQEFGRPDAFCKFHNIAKSLLFKEKKKLLVPRKKLTRLEWIEEQKFKQPKDCALCQYKNKMEETKNAKCRFHRVDLKD